MAVVYTALVHHPVYNKNREVIASALTTIDLHDLARASATFGLAGFFAVTPLEDQLRLAGEMIGHWRSGPGMAYNPDRAAAMALVRLAGSLNRVREEVEAECGMRPILAATSAANGCRTASFSEMGRTLQGDRPVVIVFGTAWGLADEALAECDLTIEAVRGPTDYNHLSVRSAAGIILDRLLGRP